MLRDIERKVLRILWNFNAGRKRMPTLHELSVKTGKIEPEIKNIIQLLAKQRYLEWDGDDTRNHHDYKRMGTKYSNEIRGTMGIRLFKVFMMSSSTDSMKCNNKVI